MADIVKWNPHDLMQAALSARTRQAYGVWLRRYLSWCTERGTQPVSLQTVGAYLTALAQQGYGTSAIGQAAAALRMWLRAQGVEPETDALRLLLRGIRRKIGKPVQQKRPFTLDMFLRVQWREGAIGLRDRALIAVGLAGALRIRELVGLNLDDVREEEQGYVITIRRSKTDQEGQGRLVAIPFGGRLKAGEALRAWLEYRRKISDTGPLFLGFKFRKPTGSRVLVCTAQGLVKRYAAQLGYDPSEFSGHSLRAGFVTSAALANAPESAIAVQTGHKSVAVLRRYIRRATIWQLNAVLLL